MNDIPTADDCSTPVHAPGLLEEILHHLECMPQKNREKYLVRGKSSTIRRSSSLRQNPYFLRTVFDSLHAFFPKFGPSDWYEVNKSSYTTKTWIKRVRKKPGGWNMMTLTLTVTYPESWFFHFLSIFDWCGEIGCRRGPQDDYSMPLAPRFPALDHPKQMCFFLLTFQMKT